MFEVYKYAGELSVSDVYGGNPEIPDDKVAVAFRPPKKGETYLGVLDNAAYRTAHDFQYYQPRIILADKPKRKVLVVEYDVHDAAAPALSDYKHVGRATANYYVESKLYNARIEERD